MDEHAQLPHLDFSFLRRNSNNPLVGIKVHPELIYNNYKSIMKVDQVRCRLIASTVSTGDGDERLMIRSGFRKHGCGTQRWPAIARRNFRRSQLSILLSVYLEWQIAG